MSNLEIKRLVMDLTYEDKWDLIQHIVQNLLCVDDKQYLVDRIMEELNCPQPDEDIETKQRELHKKAMKGILKSTHCQGCDVKMNVCFFGYCGEYCSKSCWRYSGDNEDDEEDYDCYSNANSLYHSSYNSSCISKNGIYWPMRSPKKPCVNECIRSRKPIAISGYNSK
jgi:hypothetical protein